MANQQLEYKFIPTSRGGTYLVLDGYMFRTNLKKNVINWISWRCLQNDCNATVSTVDDIVTKRPGAHTHERVYNGIKVKETLQRVKLKAKTSLTPMPTLFNEELLSLRDGPWTAESRSLVSSMPTFDSVNMLYLSRHSTFPAIPKSRREITIPEEYATTDEGEPFIIINDGADDKILGMTTTANLQYLCAADIMYGDGTFYVSPALFLQPYTIHAKVGESMIPLVFLLLPNKTKDTLAFRLLKTAAAARGLQLEPQIIQMDYEVAAKNAAIAIFPNSEWKGCMFHYTQCIWRKTQAVGLQSAYNKDVDIIRFVRRAAVLPLVPANDVEDVCLNALGDMPDNPRCLQLADYVTTFWVESDLPVTSWNHHDTADIFR